MRQVSLLFALILLWLGLPAASPGMLADEPNRAGVVIQFEDGQVETLCIVFEEDEISGADLLARSGLEVVVQPSGLGVTVCQVEGQGCAYPAQACFCRCMSGSGCAYWNYFYRDAGQADWTYSALGAVLRKVQPGSVEAWVWGDGHTPPSVDLTFEAICAPPTPTPTATAEPPPPTSITPTPGQDPRRTPSPTPPPNTATATPPPTPTATPASNADSAPALSSYWPFGLMLLGLVAIGAFVRLRRG